MAGGGMGGSNSLGAGNSTNSQIMANAGGGGAPFMGAGNSMNFQAPSAQNVNQFQQILQRLGAQRNGGSMSSAMQGGMSPAMNGYMSPAMQTANMGMQMARMGQGAPAQMPMQRPMMMGAQPFQGAQPPRLGDQMPQGMPMGLMNMPAGGGLEAILRQHGMM